MSECSHACGGTCCRDFVVSSQPEDIGDRYLSSVAHIIAGEDRPYDWDVVFIAEMLIRIDEPDEWGPRYTCKHFLSDVGLCGAYEQRPAMCRDYPYREPCVHCGFVNQPADELVQLTLKENANERAA